MKRNFGKNLMLFAISLLFFGISVNDVSAEVNDESLHIEEVTQVQENEGDESFNSENEDSQEVEELNDLPDGETEEEIPADEEDEESEEEAVQDQESEESSKNEDESEAPIDTEEESYEENIDDENHDDLEEEISEEDAADVDSEIENPEHSEDEEPETEDTETKASLLAVDSTVQDLSDRAEVKTVAYHGTITGSNGSAYNVPSTLPDSTRIGQVNDFRGQNVIVRQEGSFDGTNWVLVERNGQYIGWMLENKVTPDYETVTSDRTVAYNGSLNANGRYQIFSRPAYTEGNYQVADSNNYTGDSVVVRGEIETDYEHPRVWTLIEINGNLLGWINSQGITPEYNDILEEKTVAYDGTVNTDGRYQIFSRPAYTEDNQQVANSSDYYGDDVIVRGEIETDYYGGTTWTLLEVNGEEIGWINSQGVTPDYDEITVDRTVAYEGTVNTNGRFQIFSRPAYTEGNYQVADSSTLFGNDIVIREEVQTVDNRTWVLLEENGTQLGWINANGIEANYDEVVSSRALNHPRIIRNLSGRYQLFSAPAYTKGNYQLDNILNYAGNTGMITEERVTNRAVWHLLEINGQTLGWINDKALRKPRIYIDPGHGGSDSGASHGGVQEKDLSLKTSLYLKDKLNATGYYNAITSRGRDYFLELDERSGEANTIKADIFISVHYNSMGGTGTARGIETFIHHTVPGGFGQETNRNNFRTDDPRIKESLALADAVHDELIIGTGMRDRGVKGNNFHVVRETTMPAILLELGFLDNATERNHVNTLSYQSRAADAIVKGVNRYYLR